MKSTQAVLAVTAGMLKDTLPEFSVGDTVRVSVKVVEGSRERTQVFEGVVMRKRGGGINTNFTVRRVASHGIGVERTFLLHSPRVEKIEVVRRGIVRRAQLYYLRGRTGKAARIKERRFRPGMQPGMAAPVAALAPESTTDTTTMVIAPTGVGDVDATDVADVAEEIGDTEVTAEADTVADDETMPQVEVPPTANRPS